MTYGEVVPESFIQILQLVASHSRTQSFSTQPIFVDIGCGTGKAVVVAACNSSMNFRKVWGIEIVKGLLDAAQSVKVTLQEAIQDDRFAQNGDIESSSSSCKGVNKDKGSNKEKGSNKDNRAKSDKSMLVHVKELLLDSEDHELRADHLASALCRCIGRKSYKEQLRPFKSFQRFISEHSKQLSTRNDEVGVEWIKYLPHMEEDNVVFERMNIAADFSNNEEVKEGKEEESEFVFSLDAKSRELLSPMPEILFEEGDIFLIPWWETADVVYAASLLFSDKMMRQLTLKVSLMKPNSWFITLKPLYNSEEMKKQENHIPGITIITKEQESRINTICMVSDSYFKMSWQMARVYVYRISLPLPPDEC